MHTHLPTIVFYAGAFADPSCFNQLAGILKTARYPVVYAHVPSLNSPNPQAVTAYGDATFTRDNVLLPLLEEEKELIVVAHSYGGVVAGAAAAGLSKNARNAENKRGGILGLLYIVGNIVTDGETLLQAVGGSYPPFIKKNTPSKGVAIIEPVMDTLYNDVDLSNELELEAAMIPTALTAFETPSGPPAWAEPEYDGRRAYIHTLRDNCNPTSLQNVWIAKSAVEWEVIDFDTSHCPFISQPKELADTSILLFKKWAKL